MTALCPITTSPTRLALGILGGDDLRRVHAAALELLGVEGAAAEKAARLAPGTIVLGGRAFEHHTVLGAAHCWLGTGGPARLVRPRGGDDPRPAVAADLDEACRLADALPEVAVVYGPPVLAVGETLLSDLARCFAATSKHVQLTTLRSADEARTVLRMAIAVAGSEVELRGRPPVSLCGGADALGAAAVFARAGLPVGIVAVPGAGPADPADLAAALVRHHAGVLAACAAVQATVAGAPFFYVADPAIAGLAAGSLEAAMFQIAATQLAAHIGLPVSAVGMTTGSHEPDWQACTQNAFAALSTMAAGADLTAGAGTLGGGSVFSAQQLIMDSEIFSWNARIVAGVMVDEETIAMDAIKQVGSGGNFLGQRHTRRHMKDVWRPRLLDRSMWDAWVESGKEGAYETASQLADTHLAEHQVLPLGDAVTETLARIIAAAPQ
ncbi:MAG: trimethylamine methyltransferase family protein [Actinobacteria bacterium]|nr:trimethylamine methyltransferase family protein [Actinomycetota bacterium]